MVLDGWKQGERLPAWMVDAVNLPLVLVAVAVRAWLAYICALQGHIVNGVGTGTNESAIVYATHCSRCGAKVRG